MSLAILKDGRIGHPLSDIDKFDFSGKQVYVVVFVKKLN